MAMDKKAGAIVKHAGGVIMIKEVNADGTDLSTPDTFKLLSFIDDGAGLSDKSPIEKQTDETGGVIKTTYGDREVIVDGMFMQSDKDLLDFLVDGCRNKYFAVYRYEGIVNKNHQEFFYAIGMFTPQVELKSGAKLLPFEITMLKNESDITILNAALPAGHHLGGSTDVVIPANKYYVSVETAE